MDAIGKVSLLKDKKPSDSFVLVVQLIKLPYMGHQDNLPLYQHLILVTDVFFLPYPTLPSTPLPCPTHHVPLGACLQAGIQATDMFLLLLLLFLLLVPWLSADRLSTW